MFHNWFCWVNQISKKKKKFLFKKNSKLKKLKKKTWGRYTYELCVFDKVDQRPKNGGGTTNLGRFSQNEEWKIKRHEMSYTNGLRCWGGPDRSTKVTLFCGGENKIADPAEPNKCEYTLKFFTPAACTQKDYDDLELSIQNFGNNEA